MNYTIGIEQEFFVVDVNTFACVDTLPNDFFASAKRRLGANASREIMGSMIELKTSVSDNVNAAIAELGALRSNLSAIADHYGLALLASGTHPMSDWTEQTISGGLRYELVANAMRGIALRSHVCGIHVHVDLGKLDTRIDVMNRIQPYLPMMLALTCASPLWRGRPMGIESYRAVAYSEGPRTGFPGHFSSANDFERTIAQWTEAGFIEDASYCWWWIRPSIRFDTLELRVADSCTDLNRIAFVAALYRAAAYYLVRNPKINLDRSTDAAQLLEENLWQAACHGLDAKQIELQTGCVVSVRDQISAASINLYDASCHLGDGDLISLGPSLVEQETEARRQMRLFDRVNEKTADPTQASAVVAHSIASRISATPNLMQFRFPGQPEKFKSPTSSIVPALNA
jgi:carboxylate-amine ligase